MCKLSKPNIVTFQAKLDEFYFLGFEQPVTPASDFGQVWGNYFSAAEKAGLADPYESIIWYRKNNEQFYFVGKVTDSACAVPEGCSLVHFPACEYLVVTHEWLPDGKGVATDGIGITQDYAGIGQTHKYKENLPVPDGYVRFDGLDGFITQIEKEVATADGQRFERWVPIRKK